MTENKNELSTIEWCDAEQARIDALKQFLGL